MAVQFASQSGILAPIRHKSMKGTNGFPLTPEMSFAVIAGGGGPGQDPGFCGYPGGGGGGGFRKSFSTELSGGGAASEAPVVFEVNAPITVTVGAGGGSQANGGNSVLGSITSLGGGRGANIGTQGGTGGCGGGGAGGSGNCNGATGGGSGTSGQGFAGNPGANGGAPYGSWQRGGGGGGGGAGAQNGTGLATSIGGSSQTFSASSGGGANTGNAGQSGRVMVRYSNQYTITIGAGLVATTSDIGSEKITTFTSGTGTVSWTY